MANRNQREPVTLAIAACDASEAGAAGTTHRAGPPAGTTVPPDPTQPTFTKTEPSSILVGYTERSMSTGAPSALPVR